ncbi:hypothetical protein O6H91_06G074900 [Diphasiastrum complanatum]|uniref:Uncharacterized protein n=1 Tax=Diphasiastrum complanatum TaxID=34168 RepID=A0ACC2DFL1_DIPCM|nr:hypothetical protein O6H91_06G074900 [Diphasiastrum complanatum]
MNLTMASKHFASLVPILEDLHQLHVKQNNLNDCNLFFYWDVPNIMLDCNQTLSKKHKATLTIICHAQSTLDCRLAQQTLYDHFAKTIKYHKTLVNIALTHPT